MRNIRRISSVVSFVLALLMVAGSTGFTIIRHTCALCGIEEVRPALAVVMTGEDSCCSHETGEDCHHHGDDFTFDNDCCSHESERLINDDQARTEKQPEVLSFFALSVSTSTIFKPEFTHSKALPEGVILHCGRDLTTLHCQILS